MGCETKRLWRLLSEYEKLIAEEKLAWRKKDLQYAEDLLEQKEALIKPLGDVARALEISGRSSPEIRIRLRGLQEEQRENLSLINLQVETTKNELKSIESGRVRIQQFKNTYVAAGRSDEPPLSRFKA